MKKYKITALALSAVTWISLSYITVNADDNFISENIIHLKNAVANNGETGLSDDFNNNGTADIYDLCLMKHSFISSAESENDEIIRKDYPATAENVKLTGRTLRKDDITWLVQSGSATEFIITGTSAEITVAGDSCIYSDEKYRPRYAVYVDGELVADSVMSEPEENITLFEGETTRTAEVKVIHLSEAMNGAVGVKNISVNSKSSKAVKPCAEKDLKIEFIGDSITCAYGVEGESAYENFRTSTENFTKSYAYLTAQKLNADYSAVCYSGHGIISGYTDNDEKNTDSLLTDCYSLTGKLDDYAYEWDFENDKNDVVVINLGTNDSSYVSKDIESRSDEFIKGYKEFIALVREKNPDAYIICTMGTMGGDETYELEEKAVNEYTESTGDSRIMIYHSTMQNIQEGCGSDWHPSEKTQQASAYVLADKICQALGMESDQIGLDVASEGTYDVSINSELGGNAASYVGYDKSFWINTVTGGEKPETIEAYVSGIELKKGGKYHLEFDCYSSIEKNDVPVIVRGSNSEEYFSDSVNMETDKKHYSAEFTVSADDENSAIVFQLGGQDSYNVTISNIKLTKTG